MGSYAAQAISAKARAMYGNFLKTEDFRRLANCRSVGEAAAYLKANTRYAEVLADVNEATVHRGYLEVMIRRKIFDDYETLAHYGRTLNQKTTRFYARKSEAEQIVRCLHLMQAGRQKDFLFDVPAFVAKTTRLDLKGMAAATEFADVVRATENTPYHGVLESFLFCEPGDLSVGDVETALTAYLYRDLSEDIARLPSRQREEMRRLFGAQIDAINVSRIRRMKRYFHEPPETVAKRLLPLNGNLSPKTMREMIFAENDDRAMQLFYRSVNVDIGRERRESLHDISRWLPYLAARRFIHFSTYPAVVFASYLVIGEIERDDLIHVIEGIRYGLSPTDIETVLVLGKEESR